MAKGVAIKVVSYQETVPKLLKLIKLDQELKKYQHIVLKPHLLEEGAKSTPIALVEQVLAYCVQHKQPEASISIVEGADGIDTSSLFEEQGYRTLAEKYNIGLIDLNNAESEPMGKNEFVGFEQIMYPSLMKDAFVISIPSVRYEEGGALHASLSNMIGTFPARYYKGIFSRRKNKLDAYPFKYQVHDINLCKTPHFALLDLQSKGLLLAGNPLEMDKQAATALGLDWRSIGYLRMLDETLATLATRKAEAEQMPER